MTNIVESTASGSVKRKKKKPWWSIRNPKNIDGLIMFAICLLALFGSIMVASASMGVPQEYTIGALLKASIKPLVYSAIGFVLMCWAAAHFSMNIFKSGRLLIVAGGAILALLFCLMFPAVNNARGWIQIPGLKWTIQPSEFTKTVAVLVVAWYLGDRKKPEKNWFFLVYKPILYIMIVCFIIMVLQNDTGSALVIFLISCVCMLIPENDQLKGFQFFLRTCFWMLVALLIFLLVTPAGEKIIDALPLQDYQKYRFTSAINPFEDEHNYGYQLISGLTAFASGGMFGNGFGNSIHKYMNFPQADSDYILAILVDELGFAGFLVLMAAYCAVIYRLFYYALKMRSDKGRIILIGTAMYLVFHIFLNIGGVTGLIPLTGVPLPLISAGGSSTLSVMFAIGICQAVIAAFRNGELL